MITKNGQKELMSLVAPSLGLPTEWQYVRGSTPLTEWYWPLTLCSTYLVSVFVMRAIMKERKAWDLLWLRVIHNSFLCFGSFIMVLGMFSELWKVYQKGGVEAMWCDVEKHQTKGPLYSWYYIFYLSKFYEFIDTFILILRKKPITFLHCFHHFITAWLCWLGIYDENAVQWIVIWLNGTVHVFMYYYFLAQTLSSDVWWKKYLTSAQILQFVIDLLFTTPWFYYSLTNGQKCSGSFATMAISNVIVISFLLLFLNFYNHAYTPRDPKKATTKKEE